jgi:hypothetical protein
LTADTTSDLPATIIYFIVLIIVTLYGLRPWWPLG